MIKLNTKLLSGLVDLENNVKNEIIYIVDGEKYKIDYSYCDNIQIFYISVYIREYKDYATVKILHDKDSVLKYFA